MGDKIPNPYLAAIKSRKGMCSEAHDTLDEFLNKAVTAMDGGAWVGGSADDFYVALTGHRTTARTAADNGIGEFDDAIAGIVAKGDEMVDPDSWYCSWDNI